MTRENPSVLLDSDSLLPLGESIVCLVATSAIVLPPCSVMCTVKYSSKRADAISSIGMAGIADLQEVKKWIGTCTKSSQHHLSQRTTCFTERSRLDPNDPRNAELLQLVESIPNSADQKNYFRLTDVDAAERFVADDLMENNRRFTLLQLRDQGVYVHYTI